MFPFITAEQWSARGSMLGGFAQLGLVVVGWHAGTQWFMRTVSFLDV